MMSQRDYRFLTWLSGLTPQPDIEEFCDHFGRYNKFNDKIRRHFRLQKAYLGSDLLYFDKIYRLDQMPVLAADLSERAGREIEFERLQTGGPKLKLEDMPRKVQKFILDYTAPDYALLGEFFEKPSLR